MLFDTHAHYDDEDFDGSDPDYDANSGSGRIHRSPSGLIIRDE